MKRSGISVSVSIYVIITILLLVVVHLDHLVSVHSREPQTNIDLYVRINHRSRFLPILRIDKRMIIHRTRAKNENFRRHTNQCFFDHFSKLNSLLGLSMQAQRNMHYAQWRQSIAIFRSIYAVLHCDWSMSHKFEGMRNRDLDHYYVYIFSVPLTCVLRRMNAQSWTFFRWNAHAYTFKNKLDPY